MRDSGRSRFSIVIMMEEPIPANYDYMKLAQLIKENFNEARYATPWLAPYNPGMHVPEEAARLEYKFEGAKLAVTARLIILEYINEKRDYIKSNIRTKIEAISSVLHLAGLNQRFRIGIVTESNEEKEKIDVLINDIAPKISVNVEKNLNYLEKKKINFGGEFDLNIWHRINYDEENNIYTVGYDFNTPLSKELRLNEVKILDLYNDVFSDIIEGCDI